MNLITYKNSALFGLKQISNYRGEVWFSLLGGLINLSGLMILWAFVLKDPRIETKFASLLPYFLIANGATFLVEAQSMRFANELIQLIKQGKISSILLFPVNPPVFIYSRFLGGRGAIASLALLSIISGIIMSLPLKGEVFLLLLLIA